MVTESSGPATHCTQSPGPREALCPQVKAHPGLQPLGPSTLSLHPWATVAPSGF